MEIVKEFTAETLFDLAIAQENFEIKKVGLAITTKSNTQLTLTTIDPKGLSHYTKFHIVTRPDDTISVGFDKETLYSLTDFQAMLKSHQQGVTITLGLPKDSLLLKVIISYEVIGELLSYFSESILPQFLSQAPMKIAYSTRVNNGQWKLPDYFNQEIINNIEFKGFQQNSLPGSLNNRIVLLNENVSTSGQIILDISPSVEYEEVGKEFQTQSLPSILVRRLDPDNIRQFYNIHLAQDQSYEIVVLGAEESVSSAIAQCLVKYIKDNSSVHLPLFDINLSLDVTSGLIIIRTDRLIKGSLPQVKFEITTRNLCPI